MLSITSLFSSLQNITVSQHKNNANSEIAKGSVKTPQDSIPVKETPNQDSLELDSGFRVEQFQAMFKTYKPASQGNVSANDASSQVETDKIEQIRVNKNAVLSRINELLNEKGVEIPDDQNFTINLNLQTGLIDVSGIEDEQLQQSFLDAVQGDEQLTALLRKTREDLGIDYGENVLSRNFGIEFDSMQETPADAAISYRLDIDINPEDGLNPSEEAKDTQIEQNTQDKRNATRYQISILMSNFIPEIPDLDSVTSDQVNPKQQQYVKGNMTSVQFSWLTQPENSEEEADEIPWEYHQQSWTSVSMTNLDGSARNYELFTSQTLAGLPGQLQNSHNVVEDWLSWLNGTNSQIPSLSAIS